MNPLDYYRAQTAITDPGVYAPLLDVLPDDPAGLARSVQHLILHPYHLHLYDVRREEVDDLGFGLRRVEDMLARVQALNPAPLNEPRSPKEHIVANCRNYGVLFTSFLRHKGHAARHRVGFASYFRGRVRYDHRVTEFWDGSRWRLADAQLDAEQCADLGIGFDTLGMRRNVDFFLPGEVWLKCRTGELDAQQFGDSDTDVGMPPIRYALMHDFTALNGRELLGSDSWGELIDKPEARLTGVEWELLDRIARFTSDPDAKFDVLRACYDESSYGQAVDAALAEAGN